MHVRVVRFTDVSADQLQSVLTRIKESGGPPPDVPSTGLTVLFDEAQGTAVVLQEFATALRILHSFILRRMVVGVPSNSLSGLFISLCKAMPSAETPSAWLSAGIPRRPG